MKKILLIISLFLFSTNSFSQGNPKIPAEYLKIPAKGRIENTVDQILISNLFEIDSISGDFKTNPKDESEKKGLKIISFEKDSNRFFETEIEYLKDYEPQLLTIVDSKNEMGAILETKDEKGKIKSALGDITLSNLFLVSGNITFPEWLGEPTNKGFTISYKFDPEDTKMAPVGFSRMGEKNSFAVKLPKGSYTFFFNLKGKDNNWRRAIEEIEIKGSDFIFSKPIEIKSKFDDMVKNGTTLTTIFENNAELLERLEEFQQETVFVYFFAGYCSPCFSEQGLPKYFDMALKYPKQLAVMGIHSDSFGSKFSGCPQSVQDMNQIIAQDMNNQIVAQDTNRMIEENKTNRKNYRNPRWRKEGRWERLSNQCKNNHFNHSNTDLIWIEPSFAKKLDIIGYPAMLIFHKGILEKWFMGSDADVESELKKYLTIK